MSSEAVSSPVAPGCPKHMVYGPCGGVRAGGGCEMYDGPCVFPDVVPWHGPTFTRPVEVVPRVLIDYSAPPFDAAAMTAIARVLAPVADAVLVGEHHNRPDLPPTLLATELIERGLRPWMTLACRDRNRVVLEQELFGLDRVGVDTVLCVTGDGRGPDVRPGVTQVFDLDGTRLAALAASSGVCAAVAETPMAEPVMLRPRRLVEKQRAGAAVAVLNHVGSVSDLVQFIGQAQGAGLVIPVLAGVAVYTDGPSAAALTALPGLALDPGTVEAVLTADDPIAAGIAAAVAEAEALLGVDGIYGVNLSGSGSAAGPIPAAEIKAEVARRLNAGRPQ